MNNEKRASISMITAIFLWGGLWGIFEATAGYLLHLLPVSIGWLVWYPAACLFMLKVYRTTRRPGAVVMIGLLSACIKLLNLFLPGRIDKVLNPAISIVFEAIALAAVIIAYNRFPVKRAGIFIRGIYILCMNTGWRMLYILYLLIIAPGWIREASVIGSADAFITFFLVHNLLTCLALFAGSIIIKYISQAIKRIRHKLSVSLPPLSTLPPFSSRISGGIKLAGAAFLLVCSIALGLFI